MDSPKKDGSPERLQEVALARRFGEALDRLSPSGGKCLEPERIAAYHERSLEAEESTECERHFAACPRCRRILAVLTAADDVPLGEREVAHLGKLAANRETSGLPEASPARTRWFVDWRRWLAPALAVAAVVTVWIVMREPWQQQKSAPVMVAEEQKPAGGTPQSASTHAAPAPRAVSHPQSGIQEDRLKANRAASLPGIAQAQLESGGVPAVAAGPKKTPAAQAPPLQSAAPRAKAGEAPSAKAKSELALPQALIASAPAIVIRSPSGRVLWRTGSGGSIERSTDAGRTWRQQMNPGRADWLAGAASSNMVCWLAGRDGAIARTIDGMHWERVSPPSGAAGPSGKFPDWIAVTAGSAQSAAVTAAGGRRFSTRDGGKTWEAQ